MLVANLVCFAHKGGSCPGVCWNSASMPSRAAQSSMSQPRLWAGPEPPRRWVHAR